MSMSTNATRTRNERFYGKTAERKFLGGIARRSNDRAAIAEGVDEIDDES